MRRPGILLLDRTIAEADPDVQEVMRKEFANINRELGDHSDLRDRQPENGNGAGDKDDRDERRRDLPGRLRTEYL